MGPRSVVLGGVDTCGLCHWSLWWGSLWGHETLSCVGLTHAASATGAFGKAPMGHEPLPWVALTHAACATGAF
eukprot:4660023-Pyramimonas_sp.AAC.1